MSEIGKINVLYGLVLERSISLLSTEVSVNVLHPEAPNRLIAIGLSLPFLLSRGEEPVLRLPSRNVVGLNFVY